MTTFYKNYVQHCAKKRVSPSAAAEAVGLSRTSPNGWKKGKNPNDSTLAKLADFFEISVDELLYGQKEKSPTTEVVELTETKQKALDLLMGLDENAARRLLKVMEAFVEDAPDE